MRILTTELISKQMEEAGKFVETMLISEGKCLFTCNITYHNERTSLIHRVVQYVEGKPLEQNPLDIPSQQLSNINPNAMTSADVPDALVAEIRARLDHYFKIVVCNLKDTIPKIIGNLVVYESLPEL